MADEQKTPQLAKLNDELLKAEKPDEASKRNTKEWLIERILTVADENGLELRYKIETDEQKGIKPVIGTANGTGSKAEHGTCRE